MLYQENNSVGQNFFECIRYLDFQYLPHMHKHPELIHVREGMVTVESDGKKEEIEAGGYGLILSNRIHAYHSQKHSVVDVCIFSEDNVPLFSKEVRGQKPKQTGFACRPEINAFAEAMLFVTDYIPKPYDLKAALYAVLGQYRAQVELFPENAGHEELIYRMLRYISENFTSDITLESMAKSLGYESHYLSRYFHSRIPTHFSRFVNWYRVDMATELLRHTDLSVTEVAFRSGFQSIRSFNRVYTQLVGCTPTKAGKRP